MQSFKNVTLMCFSADQDVPPLVGGGHLHRRHRAQILAPLQPTPLATEPLAKVTIQLITQTCKAAL